MLKRDAVPSKLMSGPECTDLNEDDAVKEESTEEQLSVLNLPIQGKMTDEQDLNITKIVSGKPSTSKLKLVANRISNESSSMEGNVMGNITKVSKRRAENDGTAAIENFLQAKRLRKTLIDESKIKTESIEEETADEHVGEYNYEEDEEDDEMVIVVVQKDGENTINIGDEEEEDGNYEDDNFVEGNEGLVAEESVVSTEANDKQKMSAEVPKEIFSKGQITASKTLTVKKEICRLCLSKNCNMLPLFETSLTFIKSSLEVIIESCTGVQVLKEDATDRICRACISRLESFWAFREQCEKSDKLVKKMKEINQLNESCMQELEDEKQISDADDSSICNNEALVTPPYYCSSCAIPFHTELGLTAHVTSEHAHLKPFTHNASFIVSCSICGRQVLKKVLHDHYLYHKVNGPGNDVEAKELDEEDDDDEEGEEEEEEGEVLEENEEELEEGEEEGEVEEEEELPFADDLEGSETIEEDEQISELLDKENESGYNQEECFVTEISGSEFVNVNRSDDEVCAVSNNVNLTGESSRKDGNNPKVIAVRINEDEEVKTENFQGQTPQYTQVFLVNKPVNNIDETTSLDNKQSDIDVDNSTIHDVVATTSLNENHIYVVDSDGKAIYSDQDVVFQIANDSIYASDGSAMIKNDVEVVYENRIETVFVKEEVIDSNYDT